MKKLIFLVILLSACAPTKYDKNLGESIMIIAQAHNNLVKQLVDKKVIEEVKQDGKKP